MSTVAGGTSMHILLKRQTGKFTAWYFTPIIQYDIYIDGINEPVIATEDYWVKTDQSGVYFGAESNQSCNLDIEYVKMGTGDLWLHIMLL